MALPTISQCCKQSRFAAAPVWVSSLRVLQFHSPRSPQNFSAVNLVTHQSFCCLVGLPGRVSNDFAKSMKIKRFDRRRPSSSNGVLCTHKQSDAHCVLLRIIKIISVYYAFYKIGTTIQIGFKAL